VLAFVFCARCRNGPKAAASIAEQVFEMALVNPPPRPREQIAQAASTMFAAIAQKAFGQMINQGCDPDIAVSSSHSAAEVMHETFLRRYDALVAHGNHGSGGIN
jgi:hypothetical protein